MDRWLNAGLITRWLGQYPLGGSRAEELNGRALLEMRCDLVSKIRAGQTDDRAFEYILGELLADTAARIQLRKYKLVGRYQDNKDNNRSRRSSVGSDSVISYTDPAPTRRNNGRNDDGDASSETARRRRRREAVVIGDAGQPLSQDNIFNVDSELLEHGGDERIAD